MGLLFCYFSISCSIPSLTLSVFNLTMPGISRAFSTGLAVIKPHVPMIKFRKGVVSSPAQQPAAAAPAGPVVYEWWEVPGKFRNPAIDQDECEAINMGGGDKLWH